MSDILEDFSPQALTAAIKANLFEYYRYLGRSPGAELQEDPRLKWLLTGIPHPFLNHILCTRMTPDKVDEGIQETLASLRSRNVTNLSWWTEPGTQPINLGEHLIAHGLTYTDGGPGMALDLLMLNEVTAPLNLTIKQVEDVETLREFVHTAIRGFGLPEPTESACLDLFIGLGFDLPLRNYIGYLHGQPVATAELFLGAGVAGIYWVSTVPEGRRQGIGAAMTQAPLREARELGVRVGILHASEMGEEVYRHLGFVEHCQMNHYVWVSEMSSK